MSNKTAKNDHDKLTVKKKRFALVASLLISICAVMAWHGMHEANAQMKMHNSADMLSTKWSGTWGGWGVAGGKYGQFTCATCHTTTTTNIKRIKTAITVSDTSKGNIPGSLTGGAVTFLSTTGANAFGDDTSHTSSSKICQICHSITKYDLYSQTSPTQHKGTIDCTDCHSHKNGFAGGDCIGCHQTVQNSARVDASNQFNARSHHIQGVTLTNRHCYACHWEANSDGSPNSTYHTQVADSPVDLVIWGASTSRPTADSAATRTAYLASSQTRAEFAKISSHCLGCHNETNKSTTAIFGDNKSPSTYAWDDNSIDSKYSSTFTTPWGKYSGATVNPKNTQTKALSAHGNAANNAQGWDSRENWPNRTGAINVVCYDCHNSHGSSVTGIATSYSDTGGILKNVKAGLGGYTGLSSDYTPTAGGSAANHNPYSSGSGLCFDCHNNASASTSRPWGYSTYGTTSHIMGYFDKPYWLFDGGAAPGSKSYLNGPEQRYSYKASRTPSGGHFTPSAALTSAVTGTIRGLCTACHDPHGVSPTEVGWCSNGTSTNSAACIASSATWTSGRYPQQYGVPLLKGTWVTSPYREDAAPFQTFYKGGGSRVTSWTDTSEPGHHLDQSAFSILPNRTTVQNPAAGARTAYWVTVGTAVNPGLYNLTTAAVTSKITQTAPVFGGLCLKCHARSAIQVNTTGTWQSRDRVHNAVQGWASSDATQTWYNTNNKVHGFTCSKCHTAHNTALPRLAVTNCTDWKHRGRKATGGTKPPMHSTSSTSGGGWGRFPGGGGGYGCVGSVRGWSKTASSGAYYFGTRGTSKTPSNRFVNCHNQRTGTYTNNRWNSTTPW